MNDQTVFTLLNQLRDEGLSQCNQTQAATTTIAVGTDMGGGWQIYFRADKRGPQNWSIDNAIARNEIQRRETERRAAESRQRAAEAQQRAAEEKQRIASIKQALRAKVWSDLRIEKWARDQQLTSNPFVFKGSVVGIQTRFARMLSESEAVFALNSELVVSGVPSTLFRDNEMVIISLRVLGNKAVKTGVGEVTLPHGQYVGVYKCTEYRCMEFFDN